MRCKYHNSFITLPKWYVPSLIPCKIVFAVYTSLGASGQCNNLGVSGLMAIPQENSVVSGDVEPMIPEKISQIRKVIMQEKSRAHGDRDFNLWMLEKAVQVHHLVALPEGQEFDALAKFVVSYIDALPDCLEHFHQVAQQANLSPYTDLFLNLATDFVLAPPADLELEVGFGHLIDEAYMAHRLLEELNDRCLMYLGGPGLPMDNSFANIIVHELIGDEFANDLDFAVQFAIESQAEQEQQVKASLNHKPLHAVADASKDWPTLGEELSVGIRFQF